MSIPLPRGVAYLVGAHLLGIYTIGLNERANRHRDRGQRVFDSPEEFLGRIDKTQLAEASSSGEIVVSSHSQTREMRASIQTSSDTHSVVRVKNSDFYLDVVLPNVGHVQLRNPPTEREVAITLDAVLDDLESKGKPAHSSARNQTKKLPNVVISLDGAPDTNSNGVRMSTAPSSDSVTLQQPFAINIPEPAPQPSSSPSLSDSSVRTQVVRSVMKLINDPVLLETVVNRMMDDKIVPRSPTTTTEPSPEEMAVQNSNPAAIAQIAEVALGVQDVEGNSSVGQQQISQSTSSPRQKSRKSRSTSSSKQSSRRSSSIEAAEDAVNDTAVSTLAPAPESAKETMWTFLTSLVPSVPSFTVGSSTEGNGRQNKHAYASAWAAMEDKYGCAICHDILAAPVILPCSHDFCSECIEAHTNSICACSLDIDVVRSCPCCRASYDSNPIYERTLDVDIYDQVKHMDVRSLSQPERVARSEWLHKRAVSLAKIKKTLTQRESELKTELEADELIDDCVDITLILVVAATTLSLIALARCRSS